MSDSDRLEHKIARLSDDIDVDGSGQRALSAPDSEALMAMLLREVDETVLHRSLVVETPARATARIEAAAGRILALETAEGVLSGAADFAEVTDFAVALATTLRGFLGTETRLVIRTETASTIPQPADLRCPAVRIAALLGSQTTGTEGLTAFAKALSDHALAWRIASPDGPPRQSGDPADRIADIDAYLAKAGDRLDQQLDLVLGGSGRSGCVMLATEGGNGERLICARSGQAHLLLLARASVDTELSGRWNALFGG